MNNEENNGNGKIKLHVQVARIEECLLNLRTDFISLRENHIQHLNDRLDGVEKAIVELRISMARWGGGISLGILLIVFLVYWSYLSPKNHRY